MCFKIYFKIKIENAKDYLDGYEMADYAKQKFNEMLTIYKKGELLKNTKLYVEEDRDKPEDYTSSNFDNFETTSDRLVNQMNWVNMKFEV